MKSKILWLLVISTFPLFASAGGGQIECGFFRPFIDGFNQSGHLNIKVLNQCDLNDTITGYQFSLDPIKKLFANVNLLDVPEYEEALDRKASYLQYFELLGLKEGYEHLMQVEEKEHEIFFVYSDPDLVYVSSFNKLKGSRKTHRKISFSSLVGVSESNVRIFLIDGSVFVVRPEMVGVNNNCNLYISQINESEVDIAEQVVAEIPNCSTPYGLAVYESSLFIIGESLSSEFKGSNLLWYFLQAYNEGKFSSGSRAKITLEEIKLKGPEGFKNNQSSRRKP